MFNMCMDFVIKNKYKRVLIHVDPKFTEAKKFYEKNKFIFDYYDKCNNELNYYKNI